MDCGKVGKLILQLRQERKMTQLQLAERLGLSDRTISKWERGLGLPDVSLLRELSAVFAVNIEQLLAGDLQPNDMEVGNMKKLKFYVCPSCGSELFGLGDAEIACCGRRLQPLTAQEAEPHQQPRLEELEDELYVTWEHEMSKEHYISFAAYANYDRVLFMKLYPEQAAEVRFSKRGRGELYWYCTEHGLMKRGKI